MRLIKGGYKTISLSEEALQRLLERKKGNESVNDVVMRLTTNSPLNDFVGLLSRDSCNKIEKTVEEFRSSRRKYIINGSSKIENKYNQMLAYGF